MLSVDTPLSLYIHFPWCIRKCPYCDFNSHTLKGPLTESSYISALITDFDNELSDWAKTGDSALKDRKLHSIFLGGGTPSLFSAESLSCLIQQISQRIEFEVDIEITLEANPGTLEHDQFEAYLAAGINRLSLGIQSFDDSQLITLGRIHDSQGADQAIRAAASAGFNNLNLDLMYGLPEQTVSQALEDCDQAISYPASHLSFYQLTIEPNTYFHRFPPPVPDNDLQFEIQVTLQNKLSSSGFEQYEVSAYASPGKECRHNLNYWQFGDYLGIGAGAHSKITQGSEIFRSWKQKRPETYIAQLEAGLENTKQSYKSEKQINTADLMFEFLMNALRLKKGFSLRLFEHRTQIPIKTLLDRLQPMADRNWIEVSPHSIQCSERGYLFIDEILQELLPDH